LDFTVCVVGFTTLHWQTETCSVAPSTHTYIWTESGSTVTGL
jgi:hypothetical protein